MMPASCVSPRTPRDDLRVRRPVAGLEEGEEQAAAALDVAIIGREDRVDDGQ